MTFELARALVNLQADQETQTRYDELVGKNSADSLTSEERAELEALVRANTLLGVLKAEARLFLEQSSAT